MEEVLERIQKQLVSVTPPAGSETGLVMVGNHGATCSTDFLEIDDAKLPRHKRYQQMSLLDCPAVDIRKRGAGAASQGLWRAEWKYDGERLQAHVDKKQGKVKLLSRLLVHKSQVVPSPHCRRLRDPRSIPIPLLLTVQSGPE